LAHRFSLHANVRIAARDRTRLERLSRYLVRPPISDARLALTEDGSIALELKTPSSDGTTHFVFDLMTFLARLAALVPPPHAHLVVYHGVLASAASVRSWIVPRVPSASVTSDEPAADYARSSPSLASATVPPRSAEPRANRSAVSSSPGPCRTWSRCSGTKRCGSRRRAPSTASTPP
jgi:hypothetical protein